MYERSSLRYAHTTGHTSLIYTTDGSFILTCGSDGDIRKWRGIDDDDPSSNCLGEFVLCLAQRDDRLLASTDRNTVQAYTFPDMDNDGILLRFTAPVTCIRCTSTLTAAGSEDTNIKVLREGESQPLELRGHTAPVLSLDINSKGTLLASIAGDGRLRIWDLESGGSELKTIEGLAKANSYENAECFGTPCFEPRNGSSLAYVKGKEVCVVNTATWELQFTLSDDRVNGSYTCCQFSADGQLLAAGTSLGEISVFQFVRKQAMKCEPPSSECQAITCLAWNPKNNDELAYCDATGQLGTIFSNGATAEGRSKEANAVADENDFGDIEFEEDNDLEVVPTKTGLDDDDDDDGVSIEKLKSKIMRSAEGYVNGELVDNDTRDSLSAVRSTSPSLASASAAIARSFKQQAAFQPSSTPTHLEHRYLVWNEVGIVTSHADSADGAIDVEFHDASVHHSLHISNYNNHNMASLSSTVLALAASESSKLVCIALAASGNKEWSVQLPDCESVEAVAATTKLVAVATSMQFVRLFTVMGTQREVVSLPGPVIAMAGFEDRLLVCYHSAPASVSQQYIGAFLLQTNGLSLQCQQISFPLPAQRQLTWLGFTECGSPVFSDSMGLVQLFNLKSNCWYPICDTLKQSSSVSNNYFIISISERNQIVHAVLCRGSSYPMTNPRPMMQELPMQLPICDAEAEKSILEDALMRASIMGVDNADKVIKETAIKLFALACRSEIELRAKELVETIACPDLLMLAVKYASKLGRIHLSDRLSELMPQLEEEQSNREKRELLVQQRLPVLPLIQTRNGSAHAPVPKLAPKAVEMGAAKRATLKRFALSHSPLTVKRTSNTVDNLLSTPNSESPAGVLDTQENLTDPDAESSQRRLSTDEAKSSTRSPLFSVNPFAAKRKLSDLDKGILMSSEKLKFAKKELK